MKRKSYPCRFPGCDAQYPLPQHRGRHESQRHGMVKGELPTAEAAGAAMGGPVNGHSPSPSYGRRASFIVVALKDIEQEEIAFTERIAHERAVLNKALESLGGAE